jgi:His-Xaa-Ser system protein HxsD
MAKNLFSIDNLETQKDKNNVIVSVNPRIYGLNIIFSAAYVFIDKAYVIVDGDPNEEIIVQLKAKDKKADLEKLGREFNNELINYTNYAVQTEKTMPLRAAIVQRAFFTHAQEEPVLESENLENIELTKPLKLRGRKIGKNKSRRKKSKSRR